MIGKLFSLVGKAIPFASGIIKQRQSNKHDYEIAKLQDTQNSWKDEFVVVSFVGIFPAAFIGFLLDPVLVYFGVGPWFGPAVDHYLGFMNRILGPEYTQAVILASIGLAGATVAKRGYIETRQSRSQNNHTARRSQPNHWK